MNLKQKIDNLTGRVLTLESNSGSGGLVVNHLYKTPTGDIKVRV